MLIMLCENKLRSAFLLTFQDKHYSLRDGQTNRHILTTAGSIGYTTYN